MSAWALAALSLSHGSDLCSLPVAPRAPGQGPGSRTPTRGPWETGPLSSRAHPSQSSSSPCPTNHIYPPETLKCVGTPSTPGCSYSRCLPSWLRRFPSPLNTANPDLSSAGSALCPHSALCCHCHVSCHTSNRGIWRATHTTLSLLVSTLKSRKRPAKEVLCPRSHSQGVVEPGP